ncbi:MAG TPA: helix-turn-helix domain-containing protein [Burkholderiaceae bacterium]|nr:helix-turn-helix domain-containing protein [Burkholderiaceae bacterium]
MTDEAAASVADARSAGAMLRAAREKQGLHIAALAASIKVPQAKLEALEAGRYHELTDATFVRALAHSVCRVLKIDAKPVLELLPAVPGALLEKVDHGLKTPFHDRPGREAPAEDRLWHRPVFWLVAILLLAAVGFVLWPQLTSLWAGLPPLPRTSAGDISPAPVAKAPPEPLAPGSVPEAPVVTAPAPVAEAASGAVSEPVRTAADAASAAADTPPSGIALVRASEPSWVEARDARGNLLISRTLQPGEVVGLDGALPLKLVIGNAPATEVTLRGKRVVLGAPNRENVVRIELK